jgi:hypothetical protein
MGLAQVANVIKDPGSILDMLFGFDTLIDDITVDVLIEERPTYSWTITEKTVESGLPISDARVKNRNNLVLEILQSDDQLELSIASVTSLLDGIQTWQDKLDRFLELAHLDKVIEIQTPSTLYTDMVIKTFSPNITKDKSTALWCRIEFQEMRIVSTETSTVDLSLLDALVAEGAPAGAKDDGKRQFKGGDKGKKAGADPSDRQSSMFLQGVQAVAPGSTTFN